MLAQAWSWLPQGTSAGRLLQTAEAECSKHHRMGAAARQTPGRWGSVPTRHMREGRTKASGFLIFLSLLVGVFTQHERNHDTSQVGGLDASRHSLSLYICNDHTIYLQKHNQFNADIKLISCFNFCVFAVYFI